MEGFWHAELVMHEPSVTNRFGTLVGLIPSQCHAPNWADPPYDGTDPDYKPAPDHARPTSSYGTSPS